MKKLVKEKIGKLSDIACEHKPQFTGRCLICGKLNMVNRRLVIQYFDNGSVEQHEIC